MLRRHAMIHLGNQPLGISVHSTRHRPIYRQSVMMETGLAVSKVDEASRGICGSPG